MTAKILVSSSTTPPILPPSWKQMPCSRCPAEVWVSTQGQEYLLETPGATLICETCLMIDIDRTATREKPATFDVLPGAVDEALRMILASRQVRRPQ